MVKRVYVFRSEGGKAVPAAPPPCPAGAPRQFASLDGGTTDEGGHWIYEDGEWKFVQKAAAPSAQSQPAKEGVVSTQPVGAEEGHKVCPEVSVKPCPKTAEAGWESAVAEIPQQRVLGVPLDKLTAGDPRYNVVIRDGDTIWVPPPMQGEFYIMGNVLRPGTFSLTGREITIRQALAAAGGLAPLADPSRAELIRRIGDNQEQVLLVNIDRIFSGKESDIILKPNDVINVGSNPLMPFLAVLRNAFRMTYGFGFVYDRNFADIDSYGEKINPDVLERQERAQRFGF